MNSVMRRTTISASVNPLPMYQSFEFNLSWTFFTYFFPSPTRCFTLARKSVATPTASKLSSYLSLARSLLERFPDVQDEITTITTAFKEYVPVTEGQLKAYSKVRYT